MTTVLPPPALDALGTPVAWADASGRVVGCNPAFARWLGVSVRRLLGQPLASLEAQGDALAHFLARDERDTLRLHRLALALPGDAPRFAEGWLSRWDEGGWLLEAHPVDEFPGLDPTQALPSALSAALKGLAHELRNPLAGLKGAAQLLARRNAQRDPDERELIELIGSEIERLNGLLEQLLSPAPAAPHAPLNIHASLERVLRLAESEGGWAVRIQRDYDPSIPEFDGDADRLTQAVGTWSAMRSRPVRAPSPCARAWSTACASPISCTRWRCGWKSPMTAVACPKTWPSICSCRWSAAAPKAPGWAWRWPSRSRASIGAP